MLACWVEDPEGICFKKHLARVPDYFWLAEDGLKVSVSTVLVHIIFVYVFYVHLNLA